MRDGLGSLLGKFQIPKSNSQIPRGISALRLRVQAVKFFEDEGEDENDGGIVICPAWKVDSGAGDAGYFYAWHGFMTW